MIWYGLLGNLEGHASGLVSLKGDTELEKLDDDTLEVLEESLVVVGVLLNHRSEDLVLDEDHVGGKHHESLGGDVLELLGAVPLAEGPALLDQKLVVVVGEGGGGEGPGAFETRAVGVAASEGVGTREGDNLTVVKAHAAEDGAKVLLLLGSVGKTSVRGAVRDIAVVAARSPWDSRALHLLNGTGGSKGPKIRV